MPEDVEAPSTQDVEEDKEPLLPSPSAKTTGPHSASCLPSFKVVSLVLTTVLVLTALAAVSYIALPTVLFLARRCAEEYRRYEFVLSLSKPREEISREFYADLEALNEKISAEGPHDGRIGIATDRQRGIVIPSSDNPMMLKNLWASLVALRDGLNSTVPVTISYYGSREAIDPSFQERFVARFHDTSFMDLSAIEYPAHQRRIDNDNTRFFGFKAKVLALYAAPYDDVLLLDSDSVPLVDPALMFESDVYKEHGNVFWPDRWCEPVALFNELGMVLVGGGGTNRLNRTNHLLSKKSRQTDSGQLLFDRRQYADVLEYLLFLNAHDEYTYERAYGDKDTYEAAFFLAGKWDSFYQMDVGVSVGIGDNGAPVGFLQGGGDRDSRKILFIHRTSEAKRERLGGGGGVQWVLWETTCEWNEKYWHFFRPLQWYGSGGSGRGWENVGGLESGGFGSGWEAGARGWDEFEDVIGIHL